MNNYSFSNFFLFPASLSFVLYFWKRKLILSFFSENKKDLFRNSRLSHNGFLSAFSSNVMLPNFLTILKWPLLTLTLFLPPKFPCSYSNKCASDCYLCRVWPRYRYVRGEHNWVGISLYFLCVCFNVFTYAIYELRCVLLCLCVHAYALSLYIYIYIYQRVLLTVLRCSSCKGESYV